MSYFTFEPPIHPPFSASSKYTDFHNCPLLNRLSSCYLLAFFAVG